MAVPLVDRHVKEGRGSRPALRTDASTISYADLQALINRAGNALRTAGVAPEQRVAILLPDGPEFVAMFIGAMKMGAVPVPIYPPARMAQLEEHMRRQIVILNNAGARMLITVPEGRKLAVLLRSQVETLESVETVTTLSAERSALPLHQRLGQTHRVGDRVLEDDDVLARDDLPVASLPGEIVR